MTTVIPEGDVLEWVGVLGGNVKDDETSKTLFAMAYMKDVMQEIRIVEPSSGVVKASVPTPTVGTVTGWSSQLEYDDGKRNHIQVASPIYS